MVWKLQLAGSWPLQQANQDPISNRHNSGQKSLTNDNCVFPDFAKPWSMTDTSRHTPPQPDDKRTASLKALVRALARAAARQFVPDMEHQPGGGDDLDQPLAMLEDQE